jgi:hypothetical protein
VGSENQRLPTILPLASVPDGLDDRGDHENECCQDKDNPNNLHREDTTRRNKLKVKERLGERPDPCANRSHKEEKQEALLVGVGITRLCGSRRFPKQGRKGNHTDKEKNATDKRRDRECELNKIHGK